MVLTPTSYTYSYCIMSYICEVRHIGKNDRNRRRKKVKKKLVTLLMALCMTVPSTGSFGGVAEAADEGEKIVIDVTEYGADPTGATDSTPAIKKAIEEAKKETDKSNIPVVINFPEGRYDIYPDKAEERKLYISNTTGAREQYEDKKIGILIEGMDNVTVEGNDSLFMFHGKMTTFASIDSQNVKFQNFEVDFQVPTVVDITAIDKKDKTVTYYVPECYNYQVEGNTIKWMSDKSPYTDEYYWTYTFNGSTYSQIFDTKNGQTWRTRGSDQHVFNDVSKIEDLGNNRIQITYSNLKTLEEGFCYQLRDTTRDHAGTLFWQSKDVALNDLDIRFIHGFGMVGQFTENITMKDVDFETDKASGRTTAGYADFIQMSGCKGNIDISGCTFSNPHDDPINVHGTFLQVIDISKDRKEVTVQYKHHETSGFPNYYKGDKVEFSTLGNMVPVKEGEAPAVRTVVAVDGPDGKGGKGSLNDLTKIKLTFDQAIPSEVEVNKHAVENITYTPNVKIYNNIFKETPTRGVLCTTRGKVEITNNMFDHMGMAAIYISNDAQSWYESGRTTDVTISGNTFIVNPLTTGAPAILVDPTNKTVNGTIHKNMKIENNTFFMVQNQKVLDAKCVEDLTFKNNKVYRYNPDVTVTVTADKTTLAAGETASISVKTDATEFGTRLYNFNGCKQVKIEGNQYDGGLNAGISLQNNTTTSDITLTNDIAANNADNKLDKAGTIFYKSSNEDVVKVSSAGVVTAVGDGKADVTAYAVVGGRKFEAAPVSYTVSGEAKPQPTAIKITTTEEKLADETLTYQAEVTAADGADTAVTWSVVDPTTGKETDKATMDETSGTLTANKSGAVEVVAKTKNGLEARKLLSIQKEELELADGITVEGNDPSRWSIKEENKIEAKATQGGTFKEQKPANWFKVPVSKDVKEVTIKIEGKTKSSWEDVGLYLGKDADNYVAIQRKHRGGDKEQLGMVSESNQKADETLKTIDKQNAENLYFKLSKDDKKVTAYYSENGTDWIQFEQPKTNETFLPADGEQLYVAFGAMMDASADGNTSYVFSELKADNKDIALTQKTTDNLPAVSGVSLQYAEAENKLTAAYKLSDGADKIVKWAISDSKEGSYSVLEGKAGDTLVATPEMKDKYVKAVLIPVKASGASGDIVSSEAVQVTGAGAETGDAKSANARLATANITGLKNGFTFDKNTLTYLTTAETSERTFNVEFKAEDENATVQTLFNGEEVKGNQGALTLTSGRNIIEVTVTAADGIIKKPYRFMIFRDGDENAELTSLKVGENTVELKEDVYSYRVDVEKAGEVTVEAKANATASVAMSLNGAVVKEGKVILKPGSNVVNIVATSETSAEPTRYVVNIKVPNADSANLESVVFSDNVKLDQKFDKETIEYTGFVGSAATSLKVTAEEKDAKVKVTVNEKVQKNLEKVKLCEGKNTIKIEVTSPNGKNTETYTFHLEGKSVVYLSDLTEESKSTNGWNNKPFGKDKTHDGNPIRLVENAEGTVRTFEKGVWSHADANIYYNLDGKGYQTFETYVGVDAAQAGKGAVTFKVLIDGKEVAATKELTSSNVMEHIKVEIPQNAKELHLQALKGAEDSNDHADWAEAKFVTAFNDNAEPDVDVKSVEVTAEKTDLKVGDTTKAVAKVLPENATDTEVTWSVSDETVLLVGEDGTVTAKAKGRADVIATAHNGVKGNVQITVTGKDTPPVDPPETPDKSDLEELVNEYNKLSEKDYTADSWKAYQSALKVAKAVLEDKNATQEQIDAAKAELEKAVNNLEKAEGGKEEPEQKPDTKPDKKPSDPNKDQKDNKPAKTGDTATVFPAAVLMAACAAVVAVFVRKRREGRS